MDSRTKCTSRPKNPISRSRFLRGLDEEASIQAIVYFVLILLLSMFLYIGTGAVTDLVLGSNAATISGMDPTTFPVSQNRVDCLNYLIAANAWVPWLAALLPLLIYVMILSKRRTPGSEVD